MTRNPYTRIEEMPNLPPSYADVPGGAGGDGGDGGGGGGGADALDNDYTFPDNVLEFEIDDMDYESSPKRHGFFNRASMFTKRAGVLTKRVATNLNTAVVYPVTRIIDPIYEGLQYMNMQYELAIMKVGNPLVVKRLLYVFFMMGIVFFVSKYSITDGVNGTSGGAFSSGKFYDVDMLAAVIKDHLDGKTMKENLQYLSSMPRISGSIGDLAGAKFIELYMKNNGLSLVTDDQLQSFINYPISDDSKTYVKLADGSFLATLSEMDKSDMQYLSYNANGLSTDGEVEGHMIFVNYGTSEDFEKLKDIKLNGSIMIMKYGGSVDIGNKVAMAQQHGAKAVIFITPHYKLGSGDNIKDYDDVIETKNVGMMRYSPGDVLTPGWSSEDGYVSRLMWDKSKATVKIPTIPISWRDGKALVAKLSGSGYNFDDNDVGYSGDHTDDGDKRIKMRISNENRETHDIWNIVGSIPGREQHDKAIIIGSARDAGSYGTIGSNTGTVVFLEMIKLFTTMQRQFNWSPSRTITFVSFDATQYNLAGLSEWVEEKKKLLKVQGFTYIDLSDAVGGDMLLVRANPFLHNVIRECLKPVSSGTIQARDEPDQQQQRDNKALSLYDLFKLQHQGSDSISNNLIEFKNYIPFINLVNIPTLEIKFTGYKYPEHSSYDNFELFEAADIDTNMKKHKQLTEVLTRIVLNLAEKPILPFKFGDFVGKLMEYQVNLENYVNNALQDSNDNILMHYDGISRAIGNMREAAREFDEWSNSWNKFIKENAGIEPSLLALKRWKWNEELIVFNSHFITKDIKPKRPGYMNLLFGTPYNAPCKANDDWEWNTFPMIRDLIDQGDFNAAQHEIEQLASTMEMATKHFTSY